ncbi:response regulator transcription factor [Nonomuraea basaltis]|nr:response regulator transcription factor [Nonomuraea basaltis]
MTIRLVIADDHAMIRAGLRLVAENALGVEVVGEAADGVEAVAVTRRQRPDVLLLDIAMPRLDGLDAARMLLGDPAPPRIVMLTTFGPPDPHPQQRPDAAEDVVEHGVARRVRQREVERDIRLHERGAVRRRPHVRQVRTQLLHRARAGPLGRQLRDDHLDVLTRLDQVEHLLLAQHEAPISPTLTAPCPA